VTHFRGSDLQNYFQRVLDNRLKTVLKPQLESGFVQRLHGSTVRALMKERDECGMMDRYVHETTDSDDEGTQQDFV
jgi:translation initiation factor RLI1